MIPLWTLVDYLVALVAIPFATVALLLLAFAFLVILKALF